MKSKPKKPKSRTVGTRQAVTIAERAAFAFGIYEAMGVNRNLKDLAEIVRGLGVRRCGQKTLERYSSRYKWQQRLMERAGAREAGFTKTAQEVKTIMEERHVGLFQAIGRLAEAGLANFFSEIEKRQKTGLGETLPIDIPDLIHLAESSQRGERLARGEATSKAQVIVQVVAPIVKEITAAFMAVNMITNDGPELQGKRLAEFTARGDAILAQYYLVEGKE